MTSRERLLAAIHHEEPDRVPVSPRIAYWLMEYYGDAGLETYLRSTEEFGYDAFWQDGPGTPNYMNAFPETYPLPEVRVTQTREPEPGTPCVLVRRTFETPAGTLTDLTKIPPPRSRYGMGPNPHKLEYLVKTRDDFAALQYLIPRVNRDFSGQLAREKRIGDRGLLEVVIDAPVNKQAGWARGAENLMVDYYDDRALFDSLIGLFHRHGMEQLRAALDAGIRVIFGNWYWEGLSAGWSPAIFREVFLPLIREHAETVHAAGGIYHYYDDGKCMEILPMLREAGVDILSTCTPPPVGDFDLERAKATVGDRICLKGYVDLLYVVKLGTPELIERTVREAMEIARPGGGFILGSSDSFRDGTPVENIRAYFDAARRYGAYR